MKNRILDATAICRRHLPEFARFPSAPSGGTGANAAPDALIFRRFERTATGPPLPRRVLQFSMNEHAWQGPLTAAALDRARDVRPAALAQAAPRMRRTNARTLHAPRFRGWGAWRSGRACAGRVHSAGAARDAPCGHGASRLLLCSSCRCRTTCAASARAAAGSAPAVSAVLVCARRRGLRCALLHGARRCGRARRGVVANLFNFMDGSDGLAATMAMVGFAAYSRAWHAGSPAAFAAGPLAAAMSRCCRECPAGARVHGRRRRGSARLPGRGGLCGGRGRRRLAGLVSGCWCSCPSWPMPRRRSCGACSRGERLWEAHKSHYYQRFHQLGAGTAARWWPTGH